MFIKSYNEFVLESKDNSFEIPAESDILKWSKEAEGGDIDSFAKLVDIIKKASPKNFKDIKKINLAHKGWITNKILFESISISIIDNEVKFDYNDNNNMSHINTSLGKSTKNIKFSPRKTTLPQSRVVVFSPYVKKSSKETTEILSAIKKREVSKYSVGEEDYNNFTKRTAIFFKSILKNNSIDTILLMESTSTLMEDVVKILVNILSDKSIKVYYNSIKKDIGSLKVSGAEKLSDSEYKQLLVIVDKVNNSGEFEIKKVYGKYRKYLVDWIKIDDDIKSEITYKNVAIFDDYITTGSTLDAVCVEVGKLEPKSIVALSIIKS